MYDIMDISIILILLITVIYVLFFPNQKSMEKLIKYEYLNHNI